MLVVPLGRVLGSLAAVGEQEVFTNCCMIAFLFSVETNCAFDTKEVGCFFEDDKKFFATNDVLVVVAKDRFRKICSIVEVPPFVFTVSEEGFCAIEEKRQILCVVCVRYEFAWASPNSSCPQKSNFKLITTDKSQQHLWIMKSFVGGKGKYPGNRQFSNHFFFCDFDRE
uniref:Secreted protein n=1 Tax=Syphacia muris TaxID=451379 RepID=A0A0N5AJL3_9BILA